MVLRLNCSLFVFFLSAIFWCRAEAVSLKPHAVDSFNLTLIQKNIQSCSYTVIIKTSCSSTEYTRDQISISFGDAYGNQIYAPRLDNASTTTFETCSSDTFWINGPCAYGICYVYLYRSGTDGWIPKSVKIYGLNSMPAAIELVYNVPIPGDIWYGFDYCQRASSARSLQIQASFLCFILWLIASYIL